MKSLTCVSLVCLTLQLSWVAQAQFPNPKYETDPQCKQIELEGMRTSVSGQVAETLLIQKAEPVWKHHVPMEARVTGTVVIVYQIGKKGKVLCPRIVSGPKLLQQPALNGLLRYRYKPYLLGGKPVIVRTEISIPVTSGEQ